MAIGVTLSNVANLQDTTTAQTTINTNSSNITSAIQDGLSRSGNTPNTMGASLDMNGNRILNLSAPGGPLEPIRVADFTATPNTTLTFAAPTNTVKLAATSGSATTTLHSDVTLALDQTISPTWTGTHTFPGTGIQMAGATSGNTTVKAAATASGTLTLPATTDQLVARATTDTLTNKTFTSPTITTPATTGGTLSGAAITGSTLNSTPVGGSTPAAGTFTTLTATTSILTSGTTGGIGYAPGVGTGGTVTQTTSRSQGVSLSTMNGQITTATNSLATGTSATFIVTNPNVGTNDNIILCISGGVGAGNVYLCSIIGVTSGTFTITYRNFSAGSSTDALVFSFSIIKGTVN